MNTTEAIKRREAVVRQLEDDLAMCKRSLLSAVTERDDARAEVERLRDYIVSTPCWLCTYVNPFRPGANCGQCAKAREALAGHRAS